MESFDLLANVESLFSFCSQAMSIQISNNIPLEENLNTEYDQPIDYNSCPKCNTYMEVQGNHYICSQCGFMYERVEVNDHMSITSDNSYNVVSNGLRIIGGNAHKYQSIIRANSNSSESNCEALLNSVLFNSNHINKKGDIPKEVKLEVADQWRHIRSSGYVARGTIFRAIIAALTYYACLRRRHSFKPCDIIDRFEIDPSTYSKGDKKVREWLDYGHLDIDIRGIKAEESYAFTFASSLNLSEDKIEMLMELLQFVVSNKIINPNAKSSTCALAVISFYITATKYSMSSSEFESHFQCNFGSVRTLSLDMVQKFDMIRPIFQKYKIPHDGINTQAKRVIRRKVKKGSRIALEE